MQVELLYHTPDPERAIATAARRFTEYYRMHPREFPTGVGQSEYESRIKAAYPIHPELLDRLPFHLERLPGGHHLHLNDEAGATLVADCFNRFFAVS